MAKMYKLMLPHGQKEITLAMPYGNVTFPNGQEMPDSDYVRVFKEFFVEIPQAKPSIIEQIGETGYEPFEPTSVVKEEIQQEQPVKRKPGRPFGTFKKKE